MDSQPRFEPFVRNKKELKLQFQTCDYLNLDDRNKLFPHLKEVNRSTASQLPTAVTYVIRSNNDDDIHKSIKYGIWTSSKENNEKLTRAYIEAQEKHLDVFLYYSVVKSGQFVGVAKLTSGYKDESFPFWWETKKWKGHFTVQWIQVKDVINKNFEHLKNMESVEVTRSRDGAQVDWQHSGKEMMKIFEDASEANSILNDFSELDLREQHLREHRAQRVTYPPPPQQQFYQQQFYYQPQPQWNMNQQIQHVQK